MGEGYLKASCRTVGERMSHSSRFLPARALRPLVVALLALTGVTTLAQTKPARGFIWTVERDGRTSWLVGSLHVLTQDAYPLPAAMDTAFGRAKTLMEETDINELSSPEMIGIVATKGLFTNGETLESVLPPAAYAQLSQRMTATGLPMEMLKMMRPWMAELTLSGLELQRAGFDPELGIDVHYRRKAAGNGMALSMLETAAEQIDYLAGLPMELQVAQLQKTLEEGDTELKEVREIAAAWRAGDATAIEQLLLKGMKESPAYYQSLVVNRNRRWLPRIESCLTTGNCFIVVGAAHMVGSDGLIAMLKQKGYRIAQQ
jgi:uncharacterized protein YbaP (TraB family)